MRYTVSALASDKIQPNVSDYVTSVLDRIVNLLSTRQLTCPLYRGFGLPMRFIDKPMNVAIPIAVVEVTEGLSEWVPEAELVDLTFTHDPEDPGRLIPKVEVEIDEL